jgi:hypothetical protein
MEVAVGVFSGLNGDGGGGVGVSCSIISEASATGARFPVGAVYTASLSTRPPNPDPPPPDDDDKPQGTQVSEVHQTEVDRSFASRGMCDLLPQ